MKANETQDADAVRSSRNSERPSPHVARQTLAVIFDMDGLMFDTERLGLLAWRRAGKALGIDINAGHVIPLCGLPTPVFLDQLKAKLPPGTDLEAAYQLKRRFFREETEQNGVPKKPGLTELLTTLRERGIPAAVATSTKKEAALRMLESAGVREFFSAFVFGDEIERGKPEPDIYLAAARKLGVPPRGCLALEDAPIGAEAAVAAGMNTVMVPDLAEPPEALTARLYAGVGTLFDVIGLL